MGPSGPKRHRGAKAPVFGHPRGGTIRHRPFGTTGLELPHSSYEYGTRWAVGDVLATHPRRSQVRHAIKVNVPGWGDATFDKATFRTQIEDALRDLHAERIDIVQHLQRGRLRDVCPVPTDA